MANNKTVQALKISASWTPTPSIASKMIAAALGKGEAKGVAFAGGRISIKHAVKIDFSDPAQATRVSGRVATIKAALESAGHVHTFNTTAGAVPVDEAEVLPEPREEVGTE